MKSALIVAMMVFGATASAVHSEPRQAVPRTEQVGYADLDLASKGGDAALARRIRGASDRVCDIGGMQTLEDFDIASRCYSAAVADGQRQMNHVIAARKSGPMLAGAALTISRR